MKRKSILVSITMMLGAISVLGQAVLAALATTNTPSKSPTAQTHKAGSKNQQKGKFVQMLGKLNLTADQKAKIKSIELDAKKKLDALKANKSLTKDQKLAQAKTIHKTTIQKIKQVLTTQQLAKLKKLQKQAKQAGTSGNKNNTNKSATGNKNK